MREKTTGAAGGPKLPEAPVARLFRVQGYMWAMIASPNSEHFTSVAPAIRRAKS